jgi:hypothetical protein
VTVFVLANTEAVDARTVAYDIAQLARGVEVSPPQEHVELALSATQLRRYLGSYVLTETSRKQLKGLVEEDALGAIEQVRVVRDGGRLFMRVLYHGDKWMHFMGEDRFFFKDPSGTVAEFGPPGAPVDRLVVQQQALRLVFRREGH